MTRHSRLRLTAVCLSAAQILASAAVARADLIRLKNGGEVRGTVDRKIGVNADPVVIETLSGATVSVERRHIDFVTRRPLKVEEYETRARATPNTVEAQWELAEWCRENGLSSQRNEHLEQVLRLDPDHEKAHYGLGHTNENGEWVSRDEIMESQGYVKHKGRWITPQELEILEKSKAELDAEREWYPKVRLWLGWLNGRHEERRRDGLTELKKIDDPHAVAALARNLRDDPNKELRALYVEILGNISGSKPVGPLVAQSLQDVDYEIRYAALNAIEPDLYPVAMPLYLRELKNKLNVTVCRAAAALERVGDESVIPALIEALVTTHHYKVQVPDQSSTYSFRSDGGAATGTDQLGLTPEMQALVASGQAYVQVARPIPKRMRQVVIARDHQNAEVLTALQKLTGQSFGYDERSWKLWLAAQKSGVGK